LQAEELSLANDRLVELGLPAIKVRLSHDQAQTGANDASPDAPFSMPQLCLAPDAVLGALTRAGGATGLLVPRVPYHIIKKRGRWTSDAAMVYYRSEEDVIREVSRGFTRVVGAGL
jgi:hypothetical protein